MLENVFLVTLLPVDENASDEVFGIFSDAEKAETAIKQFSKEIKKIEKEIKEIIGLKTALRQRCIKILEENI